MFGSPEPKPPSCLPSVGIVFMVLGVGFLALGLIASKIFLPFGFSILLGAFAYIVGGCGLLFLLAGILINVLNAAHEKRE